MARKRKLLPHIGKRQKMMLRFASFLVMRLRHRICCSSLTKQWHAEHGVRLFQGWLGNSPNLNLIENLWSQMKVMQSHKRATSVAGLKRIALRVWKRIMPSYQKALYKATLHCMQVVLDAKGVYTKY